MGKQLGIVLIGAAFLQGGPIWAQQDPAELQKELLRQAEIHYRNLFNEPKKTIEFWAAINTEINLGKFELAGFFLKKVVEKAPRAEVDQDFVKIQQAIGYEPFYRLRKVQKWSKNKAFEQECRKNVETLIDRIEKAVDQALSDPVRIKKLIEQLDSPSKEVRDMAFRYLQRTSDKPDKRGLPPPAIPFLVKTMRDQAGKPLAQRVIDAYVKFDRDFMPPLAEILKAANPDDLKEVNLRLAVIEIYRRRADPSCIPYLWHLSSSLSYPFKVREAAAETLMYLREEDRKSLPSAKFMLAQMAEKCFTHKLRVPVGGMRFYKWDGRELDIEPTFLSRRDAEFFFGMRYAMEALDLDPRYLPAKNIYVLFTLERTFDKNLDKYFSQPVPGPVQDMLIKLDAGFLMPLLERALRENNVPVALPIVDILGLRGEAKAVRPTLVNPPPVLVRALNYPNQRVQFAAALAMTRIPSKSAPADRARVVEVLRRFVAVDPISKALVALCPKNEALATLKTFAMGGFQAVEVHCPTIRETFEKLRQAADYDVIFIHPAANPKDVPFLVTQLRGDVDLGRLPLFILTDKEKERKWRPIFERYPNTYVELDTFFLMPEALKKQADMKIEQAGGGYKPGGLGYPISVEERVKFATASMFLLWKMGRGEIAGYNVLPAHETMRDAIRRPPFAAMALATAALNPNRETQVWLASVFLDPIYDRPPYEKIKALAVNELREHILKHGLMLEETQIENLRTMAKTVDADVAVQLNLLLANAAFRKR